MEFKFLTNRIKVYVNDLSVGHWYWTEQTELYQIEENGEHVKYGLDIWYTKGLYKFIGLFKTKKVFIISVSKYDFETGARLSPNVYGSTSVGDIDIDFEKDYVRIEAIII